MPINVLKASGGIGVQEANAKSLAEARMKEGVTKPAYIVKIEDLSSKTKTRSYLTFSIREDSPVFLSIKCFEFDEKQEDPSELRSENDVKNYLKSQESVKLKDIRIPWHRVIYVENNSYNKEIK